MHKLLMFLLMSSGLVMAKDFIKPPSIALRTEVSFVSQMTLNLKKRTGADKWLLSFSLIRDIHNESEKNVTILVSRKLAQSLKLNVPYIVAYYTHQKTKVMGRKKYIPNTNGAQLMEVNGANPAIFRNNDLIVSQLQSYPKQVIANPQKFINNIINGMFEKDPKVQEFFVRELMNWGELHQYLSKRHYAKLSQVFNSNTATTDAVTVFLGSRSNFQRSMGVKTLGNKAIAILKNYPLELDPISRNPSLIITALSYVNSHDFGQWEIYNRWIQSNIPSIVEKALFSLQKLDAKKTEKLVAIRLLDTHLSDSSRRVLKRYVQNKIK